MPFLIGLLIPVLISSTTTPQEVKPAKPIVTEVKSMRAVMGLESDVKRYIDEKTKQGYIIKSVALMDDETWSKAIIVVEKY